MTTLGTYSRLFFSGLLTAGLLLLLTHLPPAASETAPAPTAQGMEALALFPACRELPDYSKRKACSDQKMLEYIYQHVRYPKEAKDADAQGIVVVRFSVDANGQTGLPVVVRSPHPALARATLQVSQRMLEDYPIWEAGRKDGRPVLTEFLLPIQFKLEGGKEQVRIGTVD